MHVVKFSLNSVIVKGINWKYVEIISFRQSNAMCKNSRKPRTKPHALKSKWFRPPQCSADLAPNDHHFFIFINIKEYIKKNIFQYETHFNIQSPELYFILHSSDTWEYKSTINMYPIVLVTNFDFFAISQKAQRMPNYLFNT